MFNRVPEGYQLASINDEGLRIEVTKVDPVAGSASLSIYLDGVAVISTSSEVLNVDRFVGRSPAEVEALLEESDAIKDVRISFTPFWLKRIPTLKDHIRVIVEPVEE